ncbi:MAG: dockerin type I repeat-containing protein, partial [Clostridia bacterium]|nr:dockerin type I repeat-containing protein [Clostridia bacterium]
RMTVYIDGTVKDEAVMIKMGQHDTVSDFVSIPTAYVLPADEADIEKILQLLDMHGIRYIKIRPGSALTLRKYGGLDTVNTNNEAVTLGAAEEVTFENGAYVIPTNTPDSYLIAYLFEPDSMPFVSFDESTHSLTNMLYLTGDDALYRSETDNITQVIDGMIFGKAGSGDINGDGEISLIDVLHAARSMLAGEFLSAADMNGDGVLSLVDILRIIKHCAI